MGHVNFEILKTDLLWYDLSSMIVYLMLKKNFRFDNDFPTWNVIWEQWRWDLEGAGLVSLTEPLRDVQFKERLIEAINASINLVDTLGGEIDREYLSALDDVWHTKYANNYDSSKIRKCLDDLKNAILSSYP